MSCKYHNKKTTEPVGSRATLSAEKLLKILDKEMATLLLARKICLYTWRMMYQGLSLHYNIILIKIFLNNVTCSSYNPGQSSWDGLCNYHLADISSMKQQTNKQTNKQKTYTHRQKRYGLENMHLRENLLQG